MATPIAFAAIALTMLTTACVAREPYPANWNRPGDGNWCRNPSGEFVNAAIASAVEGGDTDSSRLELKEVFFGSELSGFDVTHLSFNTLESGLVLIRPWVGEQMLKEERRLRSGRKPCGRGSWRVNADWEVMPGTAIAGLLWTGGILIPMAAGGAFDLNLTETGELAVHATLYAAGTTFVVFPMRARIADEWHLYPRLIPSSVDQPRGQPETQPVDAAPAPGTIQ